MAKKPRKHEQGPQKGLDVSGRVAWVLQSLWDGNRAAMARDVGVSHTAINRVVSGERPPGRSLLTAISGHPKVNPAWLLTGEGEPLLAEPEEAPVGGWAVPIAKRPLPGPPQDHVALLSGEAFPVARPFYVRGRYWLEVQAVDPIAHDVSHRIAPSDLLLIDTSAAVREGSDDVSGRLCVIRVARKEGLEYRLGEVQHVPPAEGEPEWLYADTFRKPTKRSVGTRQYLLDIPDHGPPLIRPTTAPDPNLTLGKHIIGIELQDIVGVCVLIIRRCR